MGEIDDIYKAKVEELDEKFLEDLKAGKSREKVVLKYQKDAKALKEEFESDYSRFFKKEKKRIWGTKKKMPKKEKFNRLEVKHFSFVPTFWERTKMRANLTWFAITRFFSGKFMRAMPSKFIYFYYKITKGYRKMMDNFWEFYDEEKTKVKEAIVKDSVALWNWFKKWGLFIWTKIKKAALFVLQKVGIKKKAKEGEGDKKADEGEGMNGKKEESKEAETSS